MPDKNDAVAPRGRVALVSGGGRGIGRAIALRLALDGSPVAITYAADEAAAQACAELIGDAGGTARTFRLAAEHWAESQDVVQQVDADLGPVQILVNNGGVPSVGQAVADADPEAAQRVFTVNAMSAYFLSRAVLPHMRETGRGDIVMISSRATVEIGAGRAAYAMSKAAMEMLAATLAIEERPNGIRVNTVAPGFVDTEIGRAGLRRRHGLTDPAALDTLAAGAPFGRFGSVDDVAGVVAFLVSPAGSYVTGQRIGVDGGGTTEVFARFSSTTGEAAR